MEKDIDRANGTTLIETYHYERLEGMLLDKLEYKLRSKGVLFKPIPDEQILDELNRERKQLG